MKSNIGHDLRCVCGCQNCVRSSTAITVSTKNWKWVAAPREED